MSSDASTELDGATDSYLLLEDGSVFTGKRFGADVSVDGEIGEFMRKREHVFLLLRGWSRPRVSCFSESTSFPKWKAYCI